MPIIDYEQVSQKWFDKLINNGNISDKNKEHFRKFIDAKDFSKARLLIYCLHLPKFLTEVKDAKKAMHDRDAINHIFKKFRESLSTSYYSIVVNISIAFVTWLNDEEKPKGFKDIKSVPKRKQRRESLQDKDMLTWKEMIDMCRHTNSIQIKAIGTAMLDGGLRPSEFIDLNYGSIERDGPLMIAHVDGKTGKREVALFKCVPYLQRWLDNHPTKKANDPLWVSEYKTKSRNRNDGIMRYKYPAIVKRIRELGKKAKIKKPLDFYALRHSSCTIDKEENVPVELAAEKHGHSVEHFTQTYGRLSTKAKRGRYKRALGVNETKIKELPQQPIICKSCDTINEPGKELCEKCGNPLTLTTALKMEQHKDKELTTIKKEMQRLNEIVMALRKETNRVTEALDQEKHLETTT